MKNKDIIILKKIIEYCDQVKEACDMFQNDYNKFISMNGVALETSLPISIQI